MLRCTVRGCDEALDAVERGLLCARGHRFDRHRAGYYNLLQPQDKKCAAPGDAKEAVTARAALNDAGVFEPLWAELQHECGERSLDVGCGDGAFLARASGERVGVDLSSEAIRRAVRRNPAVTWVVCNADRGLPLLSGTCDTVFSITARRPWAEVARVLVPSGRFIEVTPGADDLVELREAALGERRPLPAPAPPPPGWIVTGERQLLWRSNVAKGQLEAYGWATYRWGRRAVQARLTGLDVSALTHDYRIRYLMFQGTP